MKKHFAFSDVIVMIFTRLLYMNSNPTGLMSTKNMT